MAQFYGEIKGNRGRVTRTGTKNSGMQAHVRGWNIGVKVILSHVNGSDYIEVWETGGSHNPNTKVLLAKVYDIAFKRERK